MKAFLASWRLYWLLAVDSGSLVNSRNVKRQLVTDPGCVIINVFGRGCVWVQSELYFVSLYDTEIKEMVHITEF